MPCGSPHFLGFCYLLSDGKGFGDTQPIADPNSETTAESAERDSRPNASTPLQENRESLQDQFFNFTCPLGVVDFGAILVFLRDDFAQFSASERNVKGCSAFSV